MATPRADDWYRHDARKFLDGVQGMGPELIGAYIVIIDLIYARNGDMPRDDRHLSGVLGCSIRKARSLTDQLIDLGKIQQDGEQLSNERAEEELERRRNERETGSKGGRKKAENAARNNKNKGLTSTKRREEKRREEGSNDPSLNDLVAAHFPDFWEAYPHRAGKKNRKGAEAKFKQALRGGATVEQIAAGVENMRRDPAVQRGFARDPTSWLHQRGWEDEFPENIHSFTAGGDNAERNQHQNNRPSQRSENRPDPALENILRLSGAG